MTRKNVIWCVAGIVIALTVGCVVAEVATAGTGTAAVTVLLGMALVMLQMIAANSLVRLVCGECWYRFDVVSHVVFVGAAVFGALLILEMLLGNSASFLGGTIGRLRAVDEFAPIRFFAGVMVARLLYAISIPLRLAWEESEDEREAEETWA